MADGGRTGWFAQLQHNMRRAHTATTMALAQRKNNGKNCEDTASVPSTNATEPRAVIFLLFFPRRYFSVVRERTAEI